MSDLISRQAAIATIRNSSMNCDVLEENWALQNEIRRLPSAQPEIIRCKDCKYYEIWQLKSDYTDDKRYKPSVCVRGQYAVHHNPDWFCADAERREDETN